MSLPIQNQSIGRDDKDFPVLREGAFPSQGPVLNPNNVLFLLQQVSEHLASLFPWKPDEDLSVRARPERVLQG